MTHTSYDLHKNIRYMKFKTSPINICNKIIEYGLIFLVIFTPLAFGSVHPWAYSIMECVSFSLMIVWFIKLMILSINPKNGDHKSPATSFNLLFIPLVLFLGLLLLQITPFTPETLKYLSPNTYDLYKLTLPCYDTPIPSNFIDSSNHHLSSKSQILNLKSKIFRSLSIYPYLTKTMFLQLLSCCCIYLVITNNFRFERILRRHYKNENQNIYINGDRFIKAIIYTGFIASVLGLLQYFSGTEKIYWLRDASYASPFGPYINRNHFAGYINLSIPLVLAVVISDQKISSIFYHQKGNIRLLTKNIIVAIDPWIRNNGFKFFSLVLMISCLFLSASRGGFLSFWISIAVFSILIFAGKGRTIFHIPTKIILIIFISILFFTLLWSDLRPVTSRFSKLIDYAETIEIDYRTLAYIDAWKMARDFPFFGVGLGGFEILYFKYRSVGAAKVATTAYSSTHSDYLQLLTDTGWLGCLAVFTFITLFLLIVIVKYTKVEDPFIKLLAAGGLSGFISMCCHSFVDFNMQIPANVLHLFIIIAITQTSLRNENYKKAMV